MCNPKASGQAHGDTSDSLSACSCSNTPGPALASQHGCPHPGTPCCTCRAHSQDHGATTASTTAALHELVTCIVQCWILQAVLPALERPTCAVILWNGRGLQATPASTRRWAKKGWSSMTGQGTEGMPALSTAPHVPRPQWWTARQHLQAAAAAVAHTHSAMPSKTVCAKAKQCLTILVGLNEVCYGCMCMYPCYHIMRNSRGLANLGRLTRGIAY